MRKKVIAGNFKMNKTPNETKEYIEIFKGLVENTDHEVILCVPFVDLETGVECAQNTNIHIGAQNVNHAEFGAYTGEISPLMLNAMNIEYVIIGHSERRQYYNETDKSVNEKLKSCFTHNLKPILCVGETLEQRQAGREKDIIASQTNEALKDIQKEDMQKLIIAYEPIWAIGTGVTASNEDANNGIKLIREEIRHLYGDEIADNMLILYGGSVKTTNAKELFEMPEIDGGLVGGASLNPEDFSKIVNFDK